MKISSSFAAAALLVPVIRNGCAVVEARNITNQEIDVMTVNLYLGADVLGLAAAAETGDSSILNEAYINFLHTQAQTNFPERAKRIAQIISERNPDVIGLQEVSSSDCEGNCDSNSDISDAFIGDYLKVLMKELRNQNEKYEIVATVTNFFSSNYFYPDDLVNPAAEHTIMDRDVILVREGIRAVPVDFACDEKKSGDGCNFEAALPTAFGDIERGYVGVDARVRGRDYRIVNTHLEVEEIPTAGIPGFFQSLQAQELIATVTSTLPPDTSLVVLGDINSGPSTLGTYSCPSEICPETGTLPSSYNQFIGYGFTDAWTVNPPSDDEGFTCCQDANLLNPFSAHDARIDTIFSLDSPFEVKDVEIFGIDKEEKTGSTGLWPSDHAFVAATLSFPVV